jgi:hypothetical protein
MLPRTPCLASLACIVVLAACDPDRPPPATPPTSPAEGTAQPAASSAAVPAEAAPTAEQQRPLDLASFCPHDLRLYYGDQPGDGLGTNATIATGATLAVPRKPDGSVVIWVVDEKGQGLASVHVTRRMKHVRINADCSRIDAN